MLENLKNNIDSFKKTIAHKTIVVACGGISNEKEVSLASGKAVCKALKEEGLKAVEYNLTADLIDFFNYLIPQKNNIIVFNALHGGYGEDGTLAALLSSFQIPYTHSGLTASAIGMNKFITKQIARANNIKVAKDILVPSCNIVKSNPLDYPLVVKANNEGSSVGVNLVNNQKELKEVESLCISNYKDVILEEYLPGEEYSVGIINGKALEVTAIVPLNGHKFYNYEAKYNKGGSKHILPAKINNNLREYMLKCSQILFQAIGCKGIARADFKEKDGKIYLLEINTHPGFTSTSLLPEQADMCGISFNLLCLFLLQEAFKY